MGSGGRRVLLLWVVAMGVSLCGGVVGSAAGEAPDARSGSLRNGIPWVPSIDEALQTARQREWLIMIHVFADVDVPSYSATDLWRDPAVVREVERRFVAVRLNYRDVNFVALARRRSSGSPASTALLESLRIPSLPFFAIFDSAGAELARLATRVGAAEILDFLAMDASEVREPAASRLGALRRSGRPGLLFLYDSTPFGGGWCGGMGAEEPLVYDVAVRALRRKYARDLSVMLVDLRYPRNRAVGVAVGVGDIKGTHAAILFDREGRERKRFLGTTLLKDLEADLVRLIRD